MPLPTLNSRAALGATFFVLLAVVFFLPYHVPVVPSISLAYVAGFSNRAAYLLFAAGSLLFAVLVRRELQPPEPSDQPLGLPSLFAALILVFSLCLWRQLGPNGHGGSEAQYVLSRLQLQMQGLHPYRDFEFAYGPTHLYIPVAFSRWLGISIVAAYFLWWTLQWLLGTAMFWGALRLLEFPLPRRRVIFWILLIIDFPAILAEGTVYTPTRIIGAAFLVIFVAWTYRRRAPLPTALTAAAAVAIAIAISPEQGLTVFAGLLLWFCLLTLRCSQKFPLIATLTFAAISALVLVTAWRLHIFATLVSFSRGGLNFPLLPSPTNALILAIYTAAACAGVHAFLQKNYASSALPLYFSGFALLPAAMGRCDIGHLLMASPALLLGIAMIDARPMRRWMEPLTILLIAIPVFLMPFYPQIRTLWSHQPAPAWQASVSNEHLPDLVLLRPCRELYRSPILAPPSSQTAAENCLEVGRYYQLTNAVNASDMEQIVSWLDTPPLRPLVLSNKPLSEQFCCTEIALPYLHALEASPWVPKARHSMPGYTFITDYIQDHYTPADQPLGNLRIWYPRQGSPSSISSSP